MLTAKSLKGNEIIKVYTSCLKLPSSWNDSRIILGIYFLSMECGFNKQVAICQSGSMLSAAWEASLYQTFHPHDL